MKRKKRRNSDDNIRKLERKAFETNSKADIAAYWIAALRAGIDPKPNETRTDGALLREYPSWTLYPEVSRRGKSYLIRTNSQYWAYLTNPDIRAYKDGYWHRRIVRTTVQEGIALLLEEFESGFDYYKFMELL